MLRHSESSAASPDSDLVEVLSFERINLRTVVHVNKTDRDKYVRTNRVHHVEAKIHDFLPFSSVQVHILAIVGA